MPIWNILKSVPGMSPEEAQKLMQERNPWEYVILDVRELSEYRMSHIPGSVHIPINILSNCLEGFDKGVPVIVVCAVGGRSSVAVDMLKKHGCQQVYNLDGGLKAWKGLKTQQIKEFEYGVISGVYTLEQTIALAWLVEDATREFYNKMAQQTEDKYARWLFEEIEKDEVHHQKMLENLYAEIFFQVEKTGFPYSVLSDWAPDMAEGGYSIELLTKKLLGRPVQEIINTALAVEAGALDAHIIMERKTADKSSKKVFRELALMERKHAEKILKLCP